MMDAAFLPQEVVVKTVVNHKFTLELGPSITSLGRPIRNFFIGVAAVYFVTSAVQAVLIKQHRREE
jgi:hypothetical protein